MEEIYRLIDIMRMLLEEQKLGYNNINQLLHIMRNSKQASDSKRWTIVSGLRYLNLYEIGYEGNKFTPDQRDEKMSEIEMSQHKQGKFFPAFYQVFECNAINGLARFDLIMN